MKIGIDARFIGPQGTGLGKYTEKLILNLTKIDKKNQYVIFLRKENFNYLKIGERRFKKVLADIPWYSLREQLELPKIFAKENLDLLHVPHFNAPLLSRQKFIVTIHDLIHHQFSETSATTKNQLFFKIKRFAYKRVIKNAIFKSQKIIAPSNFVKSDILKNFKVEPNKIVVTYEAAEEEYSNDKRSTGFASEARRAMNDQRFLIYVGNAYPHKNLERLLDAIKILNTKLILVCPRGTFSERLKTEIEKRDLQKKVDLKGYLEPKELNTLFQKATAYVFPSLSEGFGIPGLNAMASGLPVVCSNIAVLKEIYGDAAIYFDPKDEKDIAKKINQILTQPKTRSDLVKQGIEQVKKYSWLKMAQQTLKIYESA